MVWKSTQKVGFGFAIDEAGIFYVVANYFPAGNYKNEFNRNVLPVASKHSKELKPAADPNKNSFLKEMISKTIPPAIPSSYRRNVPFVDSSNLLTKINNEAELNDESIEESSYDFNQTQNKFIQEALQKHNECRRKHGVQPLVHNPELSMIAQQYADYLARINKLVHSKCDYKNDKMGENLAYSYDTRISSYSGECALFLLLNQK